jgi:hypothetical protein
LRSRTAGAGRDREGLLDFKVVVRRDHQDSARTRIPVRVFSCGQR